MCLLLMRLKITMTTRLIIVMMRLDNITIKFVFGFKRYYNDEVRIKRTIKDKN